MARYRNLTRRLRSTAYPALSGWPSSAGAAAWPVEREKEQPAGTGWRPAVVAAERRHLWLTMGPQQLAPRWKAPPTDLDGPI